MEILSPPYKFDAFQVTTIRDKFGVEKVEVKYFKKGRHRSLDFHNYQVIYFQLKDWDIFKKMINGSYKQAKQLYEEIEYEEEIKEEVKEA